MLTNERIDEIAGPADYWDRRVFARAVEAAATEPLLERIAALEAKLAQRVPDGWAALLKAAQDVLSWTETAHRPPVRDVLECGRGASVRIHALADLHDAVQALSAAPAAPEQQSEAEKLLDAAGLCRRCAAPKE